MLAQRHTVEINPYFEAQIGLREALLILQTFTGTLPVHSSLEGILDLDGDDRIGLAEAMYILQLIARLRH